MQKHPRLTEERIKQFLDRFTTRIYDDAEPLAIHAATKRDIHDQKAAQTARSHRIESGFAWGPPWGSLWLHLTGKVPSRWKGKRVIIEADLGSEATIWRQNEPIWGFDIVHRTYLVTKKAVGGEAIDLWVQAYGGSSPGVRCHGQTSTLPEKPYVIRGANLRVMREPFWHFSLDIQFALNLLKHLPATDPVRSHLLLGLNEAINLIEGYDDNALGERVDRARARLHTALADKTTDHYHRTCVIGHAHLDTVWLWPKSITQHKMAHTSAIQLALLDEYPEYRFAHTQAAQYDWVREQYPKLFRRIKAKVKANRWYPAGSMWIEADTNVTGGESIVRQFLYGKRFFREQFGVDYREAWLPDSFGICASLPQILVKSGIDYFMTQKISWSQFNRFPHHTFWWQGIDGSRIWTHFLPADTYNGSCQPHELRKHLVDYQDHGRSDYSLYLYGEGDGGGGPSAEYLELLRRAETGPCLPRIDRRTPAEFIEEARARSHALCTWNGELYLEYHRGTYTTQANTKRNNRRCEFLLRDLELLASMDPDFPKQYPAELLEALWKVVLLNQFHDILPGTSVRPVYEQVEAEHESVLTQGHALAETLMRNLVPDEVSVPPNSVLLFQFADVSGQGTITPSVERSHNAIQCGDERIPLQHIEAFGSSSTIFSMPSSALNRVALATLCHRTDTPSKTTSWKISTKRLTSDRWDIVFDNHGNISQLTDIKTKAQYIAPNELANVFQLFDDQPLDYSAWDIDAYALETGQSVFKSDRVEIVERGPVRIALEIEKRFGKSRLIQRISLGPTPGIRFDVWVDWRESNKLLKVTFPLNINTTRATFNIQFGYVERETHRNTSWQLGKFEVCGHKWVDLSEGNRGVALLNDCKYGHDIEGHRVRLTLLRSPKAPDPEADMGEHRFTYVLLPHEGSIHDAQISAHAYALNTHTHVVPIKAKTRRRQGENTAKSLQWNNQPFIHCDTDALVIESVKKAEDAEALIVRLYETYNTRGKASLRFRRPIKKAFLCNLMETEEKALPYKGDIVELEYNPFEIITLKLLF